MTNSDEPTPSNPAPRSILAQLANSLGPLESIHLSPEAGPAHAASGAGLDIQGRQGIYAVEGEVARGGMGIVFKGRDGDLGREVAIKVLHEGLSERKDVVQRFVEEAQIGGQLQHPGIVPVYELGALDGQQPFFTMKFVRGRTLSELLKERKDPSQGLLDMIDTFEDVCLTVAYAHSRSVIHRDLKPANVMVGAFGEVQVVDWGLAKVLTETQGDQSTARQAALEADAIIATVRSGDDADASHSISGAIMGTLQYMPPEQAQGRIDELDERADVFSLGAILCEILTGKPPYAGEIQDLLDQAANAKLEAANANLAACGADAELVSIARDCLVAERDGRLRDALVIAQRLRAYLMGIEERARKAEVEAAKATVRAKAERKAKRLTMGLGIAILGVLTLSAGVLQNREKQRKELTARVNLELNEASVRRAEEAWPEALAAAQRADVLVRSGRTDDQLVQAVASQLEIIQRAAEASAEAAQLNASNQELLAALADIRQPEGERFYKNDWSAVEASYARIFEAHGLDLDAGDAAHQADAVVARGITGELAANLDIWSIVRMSAGDPQGAARLAEISSLADPDTRRDALRTAVLTSDRDHMREATSAADLAELPTTTLVLLGAALRSAGLPEESVASLEAAIRVNPGDFAANMGLARALQETSPPQYERAARHYTAAMALRPTSIEAPHELIILLDLELENDAEAMRLLQATLDRWPDEPHLRFHRGILRNARGGPGDHQAALDDFLFAEASAPNDSPTQHNIGETLTSLGREEEAVARFERAIELDSKIPMHHWQLGSSLATLGHYEAAVPHLEHALELDPDLVAARNELGHSLARLGQLDRASAIHEQVLELDPNSAEALRFLAFVRVQQGALDEALELYARGIASASDPKLLVELHYDHGITLRMLGRHTDAEGAFRSGLGVDPDHARCKIGLGNCLIDTGRMAQGVPFIKAVLAQDPTNWEAHLALASSKRMAGDPQAERKQLDLAISQVPGSAKLHYARGLSAFRQRDYESAAADFAAATQYDPSYPEARINLTASLCMQSLFEEAYSHARIAVELAPDHYLAQWYLSQACSETDRIAESLTATQAYIDLKPNDPNGHHGLAWYLATAEDLELRDFERAVVAGRRAVELGPGNPTYLQTLGVALFQAGQYDESGTVLEELVRINVEYTAIGQTFLARVQHLQGKTEAANATLERAESLMQANQAMYGGFMEFLDIAVEAIRP